MGKVFLTRGTAYIFLGSVEYERSNLQAAERYFKLAIASCAEVNLLKEINPHMHTLLGQMQLARINFVRRDTASMRPYLEAIGDYLSQNWIGAEVFPAVKGEYALLMHELGEESVGRQWLEEFPLPEPGEQMVLRQLISLNHLRPVITMKLLLLHQRWQEAERVLQDQQALAEQQGSIGSLIQWLVLRALLKQGQDETGQVLLAISRALSLAETRGYLRIFLDAGAPLMTFLYRLRQELRTQQATGEPTPTPGYLDRLVFLFKEEQHMGRLTWYLP
jgi:LuxR family transcriptional regulator, maltose regulon positive regulatory protein